MAYPVYYVPDGDTLPIFFDTFDGGTGASITMSGLAVTDIEIYKDGSTTQRASDNGYTLLDTDGIDFDTITGIHGFSIDLSDNSDAGFYAVGSWYHVVVSSVTVDGQTVNFVAAAFRIMPAEDAGAGIPDVNVTHIGDTSQTAGDLMGSIGEENASAAAGDPSTTESLMQYIKQLVNVLIGTTGVTTYPAAAAPGDGVSLAEVLRAVYDDTNSLDGTKIPDTLSLANIQSEVESALEDAGNVLVITTIATLTSQTVFTLTDGSSDDDAYNNCVVVVEDASTAAQKAIGYVLDYTGSTKQITLGNDPGIFTMAASDKIAIISPSGVGAWRGEGINAVSGGAIPTNVQRISGDSTAALNLEADYDGTGYNKSNSTIGTAEDIGSTGLGNINTEVDNALDTAIPGSPTSGSINERIKTIDDHDLVTKIPDTLSLANINGEVLDVMNTDNFGEPGQEAPAASTTLADKIGYLYKFLRNKIDNDGSTIQVYADDTTTVDHKATVSESGGTVTRDEFGTGP